MYLAYCRAKLHHSLTITLPGKTDEARPTGTATELYRKGYAMTARAWIEMPVVPSQSGDGLRPKYSADGRVMVVHHMGKAYAAFENKVAQEQIAAYADCRRLTPAETLAFERALPFPVPSELFPSGGGSSSRGLGDLFSGLMGMLGVSQCSGCQRRKRRLNEFMSWGWSSK